MRRPVCRSLAILSLLLFVPPSAAAAAQPPVQDADVAGAWALTMETPQGVREIAVTFEQDGQELTGTFEGQMGPLPLSGRIDGNDITFDVEINSPQGAFTLEFAGTVDGGTSMSGTMTAGGGQFSTTFTAEKSES